MEKSTYADIAERGGASSADVAAELGASVRTARRIPAALVEKGTDTAHGNTSKRPSVSALHFVTKSVWSPFEQKSEHAQKVVETLPSPTAP